MLFRLLAAFILVPLIELYLLLQLAEVTNVLITIAVVVGTGILGSFLARREGLMAWYRFRSALAEGRMPAREIQDGFMIVFAAALLLTPGLLTDLLGFTLLVPPGRDLIRRLVLRRYVDRVRFKVTSYGRSESSRVREDEESRHSSHGAGRQGYTIDAASVERKG